jgi:integrase
VRKWRGLRIGEALGLDRADVDLDDGALHVRAAKQSKQCERQSARCRRWPGRRGVARRSGVDRGDRTRIARVGVVLGAVRSGDRRGAARDGDRAKLAVGLGGQERRDGRRCRRDRLMHQVSDLAGSAGRLASDLRRQLAHPAPVRVSASARSDASDQRAGGFGA